MEVTKNQYQITVAPEPESSESAKNMDNLRMSGYEPEPNPLIESQTLAVQYNRDNFLLTLVDTLNT